MRVAFRVDASISLGLGHLKRCLSLTKALIALGAEARFVFAPCDVDVAAPLTAAGVPHTAILTRTGAFAASVDAAETIAALRSWVPDVVVTDHYEIDASWHDDVRRELGVRMAAIDDLGNRRQAVDVLIDHNVGDHRAKYLGLIEPKTMVLGGPRFALLDPLYEHSSPYRFEPEVRSVGIFMGGADVGDFTTLALRACREVARFAGRIEVVTTSANPHRVSLAALVASMANTELLVDLADLAAFFVRHDLQIGAGGGATWERCRLGVPTLALVCADNQLKVLAEMGARGIVETVQRNTLADVGAAIGRLLRDEERRRGLHERSLRLVDGRGASRVSMALWPDALTLRPATEADAVPFHAWRNDPRTRRHFRDPREIALNTHVAWWSRTLADPARRLLVACFGERVVGSLRLDLCNQAAEVSLYLDPELAGLGIGTAMLRAAQAWSRLRERDLQRLTAVVLEDNAASAAAFRKAGFRQVGGSLWKWEVAE
jgi:UDP-2,4-diacetamido-2,4,6-trideoxy-beta-L-altropyranose hydrolase